jgi:RNA polymerase sigma factor (sigma-70 family)
MSIAFWKMFLDCDQESFAWFALSGVCHLFAFRGHVGVMNMILMDLKTESDEQLCQASNQGDREAFGRIVERYQTLICSLAYSATGNLAGSQDLAQEAFVTAWRRLSDLREPAKLRAWLCGIVRNLAANNVRRNLRRGGEPESLELADGYLASDGDPASQAVTREEETLLWRALGDLPESYREPLVLFYREQQSVAEVATQLELSEEAVKQRLSRGRAMLRAELAAVVESALTRTRPNAAFTASVLVALGFASAPPVSAAVAAGVVAGKGAATVGKGALAGAGLGAIVGPVVGVLIGLFSSKAAALTARSPQERKCILGYARRIVVFCFAMSVALAAVLSQAGKLYPVSPGWLIFGVCAWTAALLFSILFWCARMQREVIRIRAETGTGDSAYSEKLAAHGLKLERPTFYESKLRLLGLPLVAFAYGGSDADSYRPRTVCGWMALGDRALSPFLAVGGLAIAPIAIGAITIGIFSISLWGVGVGVLAIGSIAIGWWAFGLAAVGGQSAAGVVAVAHDYALGPIVRAAEANTPAAKEWFGNEWFQSQWFMEIVNFFLHSQWWILLIVVVALGLRVWRGWQLRRLSR